MTWTTPSLSIGLIMAISSLTSGILSAASIITINDEKYNLSPNQSKVVGLLFKNLTDALDGLSYRDMVRETDLTRSGKLSNYFKVSPRIGDLFNYSRRTGKYSLRH